MAPIRIGITGSGFMGRTHADAAARLDDAELVGIAGGSRAKQLADDYSAKCFDDYQSLVACDDIDAVVITTPHYCHYDEVLAAAEAGKHVLVEKPLATSMEHSDQMIQACRQRGLVMSVGYHQRFREGNYRTRDLIRDGAIGRVRCIQTSALFDITKLRRDDGFGTWSWWTDPRSLAHLINSAPHTVDLCRWWLGCDLQTVSALSGTFREENPNENTTMALLEFTDTTMCTFWSSSVLPSPGFNGEDFRFRIMGDEGLIDLDPYGKLQLTRDDQTTTVYEQPAVGHDDSSSAYGMPRMQAYCDQMSAFLSSIRGEYGGEGTAGDGWAGVQAVLAMLEAARDRKTIALPRRDILLA